MADLVAFMGAIVVLASFGRLCLAGYRYLAKRFEVDVAVKRREDRD